MRAHRKSGTPQARSTQFSRLEARRHSVPALNHHVAVGGCYAEGTSGRSHRRPAGFWGPMVSGVKVLRASSCLQGPGLQL